MNIDLQFILAIVWGIAGEIWDRRTRLYSVFARPSASFRSGVMLALRLVCYLTLLSFFCWLGVINALLFAWYSAFVRLSCSFCLVVIITLPLDHYAFARLSCSRVMKALLLFKLFLFVCFSCPSIRMWPSLHQTTSHFMSSKALHCTCMKPTFHIHLNYWLETQCTVCL